MICTKYEAELDYVSIGKRIRAARLKAGLQQSDLAGRADLTNAHMSHIETGRTKAALATIVRIANVLSVSVDDFLCDNLEEVKAVYDRKIADELADCDAAELEAFFKIIQATKKALRTNRKVIETGK